MKTSADRRSHECQRWKTFWPSTKGSPVVEPVLSAVVGPRAQLLTLERSPRHKNNTLTPIEHSMLKATSRRGEGIIKVAGFESQSPNSRVTSSTAGHSSEGFGFLPSSPCVLHFARGVVKCSAFDEQVRGQLRTTGQTCKLGRLLDLVDVGTYAKLCNASVHDLIKSINHNLQNVKVHKKPCEDLFSYVKKIDEQLSSLFKSLDMASLSHGVHRLLGVLKKSLADAYILFKRCESRSPIHVNVLSNIPAKLIAIEEEIHRIIPVLRLALVQHQEILTGQANVERVAFGTASDDDSSSASTPPAAISQRSSDMKHSGNETKVSNARNLSPHKSGLGRCSLPRNKKFAPWHKDIHHLKMHRWGIRTYLCKACQQVGDGCVFSCDQCNYHVHPSCVELNEAIQQLEEIRINKLSICNDSVNPDRDLCGLVR